MDFKRLEIAIALLDRGRADIAPGCDVRNLCGFYAADSDIVRQLDQDLASGGRHFKRLLFYCRDFSTDRNRFTLWRLRLSCVELNDTDKRNESDKPERVDSYSLNS